MVTAFATTQYLGNRSLRYQTAILLTGGDPDRSPTIFRRYGCSGCHTIPGVPGADGLLGPALSGLSARVYIAGVLPNTADNLEHWIVSPQQFSPHSAMPETGITSEEAKDLAAYLYAN
ncbi:cytochrome C [Rhizobium vallis]|uniref:Cytochrome C n=1 Tax=Rhizobium vallis TaxID=634290 RepID=A0A3S0QP68_9HYPH|nr:c-type cytochrome [Rhizobium vallis]RUM24186.1 cytochrome C [Rhizobium vallis]